MVRKIGVLKGYIKNIKEEISKWESKRDNGDKYWTPKKCEKEIKRCNKQLDKALEEYKTYEDYEASKNEPTIIEFFERWEKTQREWLNEAHQTFIKKWNEYDNQMKQMLKEYDAYSDWGLPKDKKEEYNKIRNKREEFYEGWYNVEDFIVSFKEEAFNAELDNYILVNRENLMYDLFCRIYKAVGKIEKTDLRVGMSNFGPVLEGYISGENANAMITTIGAGGYNIQKYHYRVLIKVADKEGNKIKKENWRN